MIQYYLYKTELKIDHPIIFVYSSIGIKDFSSIKPDASLGDLGLDSLTGVEVKQTLERDFQISLSMREIQLLSLAKLREIDCHICKNESSKASDTQNNYIYRFDMECLVPKDSCILMKKGADNSKIIFLVHPIEGTFCT